MDRIRNARHFAPRLQRWLDELSSVSKAAPQGAAADVRQLDMFGQETGAATRPAGAAVPPGTSLPHGAAAGAPAARPPVSPYTTPKTVNLAPAGAQLLRAPGPDATGPDATGHGMPGAGAAPPLPRMRPPAPPPELPPRRQLMVGEFILEYTLRRSTRRSIGFMIDDEGLRVTAPKRVTIAEIDNAIRTKQHWILSKLHERRERRAARLEKPPVEWIDGAALPYLGGEITLRLLVGGRNRSSYNPATRELSMVLVPGATEVLLKERVRAWLQQQARELFEQRLDHFAVRLGVRYHSLALSSAGTRWGSCTADRKIRLNWKLIHFSLPLIDYVIAHELSHILEMNHSQRFWDTVATIYPEYEEAKQLLRKRAQELPVLFA